MRNLRAAWAFLTRLPGGPPASEESRPDLAATVPWFPVVGLVIGAIGAATYAVATEVAALGALPAAGLTFAVTALVTGAIHEDGLADSFDGLVGGWTVQRRLEILRDSRLGTYGALALILVTLVKVTALAELDGRRAAEALIAGHTLARGGAVGLMSVIPQVRRDGLGADHARGQSRVPTVIAVLGSCAVGALALGPVALVACPAVVAAVAAVGLWARARLGGITGDLLGAAEQVGEIAVLVVVAASIA